MYTVLMTILEIIGLLVATICALCGAAAVVFVVRGRFRDRYYRHVDGVKQIREFRCFQTHRQIWIDRWASAVGGKEPPPWLCWDCLVRWKRLEQGPGTAGEEDEKAQ